MMDYNKTTINFAKDNSSREKLTNIYTVIDSLAFKKLKIKRKLKNVVIANASRIEASDVAPVVRRCFCSAKVHGDISPLDSAMTIFKREH